MLKQRFSNCSQKGSKGAEKGLFAVITGLLAAVIVMLIVRRIRKESNKEPFAHVPFLGFGAMLVYVF